MSFRRTPSEWSERELASELSSRLASSPAASAMCSAVSLGRLKYPAPYRTAARGPPATAVLLGADGRGNATRPASFLLGWCRQLLLKRGRHFTEPFAQVTPVLRAAVGRPRTRTDAEAVHEQPGRSQPRSECVGWSGIIIGPRLINGTEQYGHATGLWLTLATPELKPVLARLTDSMHSFGDLSEPLAGHLNAGPPPNVLVGPAGPLSLSPKKLPPSFPPINARVADD